MTAPPAIEVGFGDWRLWLLRNDPAMYRSNRAALARHRRRRGKA